MTEPDRLEFGPAFIDADEHRPKPVPHRFVHGGFEGTNVRFRLRFPDEGYRGRMLQVLGGGQGGREYITDDDEGGELPLRISPYRGLLEAARRGAFLVESNEGFRLGIDEPPADLTVTAYRATEETARFALRLAAEHHGREPERRYLVGFSGGGNRTVNALEHTNGLYDGGVASGLTTMELNMAGWSAVADAQHILRDVIEDVIANADAGGTGDLFAGTRTDEQREILAKVYASGFPFGNERALRPGGVTAASHYLPYVDPGYERDFFETPGYAGADGLVERVRGEATVTEVVPHGSPGAGIRLDTDRDPADLVGATISVIDGPRAGGSATVAAVQRDGAPPLVLAWAWEIEVGDRVSFDNARALATRHYHRDAHRRPAPRYAASLPYTGQHEGKLLVPQLAFDHATLTAATLQHAARVVDRSRYRLWWIEKGDHAAAGARVADNAPPLHRALDDLIAWVEDGVEPPPDTRHEVDEHGILRMPATARERGGIDPTITLEADGVRRVAVRAGRPVVLRATAEAPAGDEIIEVAWDPLGTGEWEPEEHAAPSVVAERTHVYSEPGVYLAGARARSRRPGSDEGIDNISHARIVVEP